MPYTASLLASTRSTFNRLCRIRSSATGDSDTGSLRRATPTICSKVRLTPSISTVIATTVSARPDRVGETLASPGAQNAPGFSWLSSWSLDGGLRSRDGLWRPDGGQDELGVDDDRVSD